MRPVRLMSIIFLLGIFVLGITQRELIAQITPEDGFINKPIEELSPEEKFLNVSYLEKEIKKAKIDRLSFLIEKLKDPKYCYLSREALTEIGGSAIPPLREVLRDRKNIKRTRIEALKTLRELGDNEAYVLIEDQIKPISPVYDLEEAEFQNVYLEMKLQGLKNAEKLDVLIQMLKDKNKSRLAREALIKVGKPAVPQLIEVLKEKGNPFISRLDALWSLKEIKDTTCVPDVIDILKNPEETDQLRELAAYTLGEIKDERAILFLEEIIESWAPRTETGPYDVRKSAKEALEKIRRDK